VNQELLPVSLRSRLPTLGAQSSAPEPIVYAHYYVPDHGWAYYVTEGGQLGEDYAFYGFLIGSERDRDWNWRSLRLSDLEQTINGVVRNEGFTPGRLTDVVVLPLYEE
jgi:hypothetical protein